MAVDIKHLPDDLEKLKYIISEIVLSNESLEKKIESEQDKYRRLEEQYRLLKSLYFGRKSEKLTKEDENQMHLFNEAEGGADDAPEEQPVITVSGYTKKKPGRKSIPDSIPREEIIHDLSDEEKKCPCCSKERPLIGRDESEELEIIPAEIKVLKHVRLKYGPCKCEEFFNREIPEVKTAMMPWRMIPGSIAGAGLLSYVLVSKFEDHLPFYRQSRMFTRIEVDISRATMANWAIAVANRCGPLIDLMIEEIRSGPLIQMDETTLKVIHEPERSKAYMWVAVGYPRDGGKLVLYRYHATRSENVPLEFMKEYRGFLQSDGYAGYNKAGASEGIIHVGCWAHARRYFHGALKLNRKSKTAFKGLSYVQSLYAIERDMRERKLEPDDFVEKRKEAALPVLDSFRGWLVSQKDSVPPQSKTGEAIAYTLGQWDKLVRYLDHHLLTPDNNAVENAIRPFVLGRKNWLFSNTPRGAGSSAVIYSLIESAKANGLEPFKYLRFLFENLPGKSSPDDLRKLLPCYLTAEMLVIG